MLWSRRFGDTGLRQRVRGLTTDAAGNVLLVGEFDGTVDFGAGQLTSAGSADLFVVKLPP